MFINFSYELMSIINNSKKEMSSLKHSYIGTEHFILSLLKSNSDINRVLKKYNITYETFRNKVIDNIGIGNNNDKLFIFTPLFKKVIEDSIIIACEQRLDYVEANLIFKEILDIGEGVAYRIICELGVDIDSLYDEIDNITIYKNNKTIMNYGVDLTEKVEKNITDPVIGRNKEIEYIIEILLRKNKKNPLLIGPAGVGKTAIVEGLADRIINKDVPYKLWNKRIVSISMASLVAGTKYRGEFEEKLLKIINELEKDNNYIIFIDEIHTIVNAGGAEGAIDAGNILKPALARGNITVIGATTTEEYRKYIENDKALSRRFQKVLINEPSDNELLNILKKIKPIYEKHHKVIISDNILKYIIKISKKYLKNRKEPDRSIDVLDEVSSLVSSKMTANQISNKKLRNKLSLYKEIKRKLLNNNDYNNALQYSKKERIIESKINKNEFNYEDNFKEINEEDVNILISKKYNVILGNNNRVTNYFGKEKEKLNKLLKKCKIEINNIMNIITDLFICNKQLRKPISILINDEKEKYNMVLNKIGKDLFDNNIIKIDLNDYSDNQSISKIIGALPGYIGYNNKANVFESLKEQPFNIIIFDNYEKSCKSVKNLIKEILNKGYFVDSNNYVIDFMNCLIIIYGNDIKKSIGFDEKVKNNNSDICEFVSKEININNLKISML